MEKKEKCIICGGDVEEVITHEFDLKTKFPILSSGIKKQVHVVIKDFYCQKCGSFKHSVPKPKGIEEIEECVLCGKETEYYRNTPIDKRKHYVEGCGQLCEDCDISIYEE